MKTICSEPGCNAITSGARCSKHRVRQGSHHGLYNNARWRKCRKNYLRIYPLCQSHLDTFDEPRSATVLDHIVPHGGDLELFWDHDNWQPLCRRCHAHKSALEMKLAFDPPLDHRLFICGLPGSGKSTAARALAEEDGRPVFDADELGLTDPERIQRARSNFIESHERFICIVTRTLVTMRLIARYAGRARNIACTESERSARLSSRLQHGRSLHGDSEDESTY